MSTLFNYRIRAIQDADRHDFPISLNHDGAWSIGYGTRRVLTTTLIVDGFRLLIIDNR